MGKTIEWARQAIVQIETPDGGTKIPLWELLRYAEDLEDAARRLISIPAVGQILGTNHTPSCSCGFCDTRRALED